MNKRDKIIHFLGKHFRFIRTLYQRKTGKTLWGIIEFIASDNLLKPYNSRTWNSPGEEWLDEALKEIFKPKGDKK